MQKRIWLWLGLALGLLTGVAIWQLQQDDKLLASLPAGEGKEILGRACLGCHGVEKITQAKPRSAEGWEKTIVWMQKMQGMGPLAPADQQTLVTYLSQHFGAP